VIEELIDLGARSLVRIGTCGALAPGFALGELVAAATVVAADGTSAALGAERVLEGDADLTAALTEAEARPVRAVSTDLFYDPRPGIHDDWRATGAEVVEMEAATLLAVAARRGVAAAVVLAVSDLLDGDERRRIEADDLERAGIALGEAGYAALAAVSR
jgi:uridine phosphorylase